MAQKNQFIVTPETCAEDMLVGVRAAFPGLAVDVKSRVILHAKKKMSSNSKVGLLSGGGSGHEPFAAGFVGENLLTAAVAGSVFSSPPPSHILTAIYNVASVSPGGVLVFILNYTGDILNFGLAMERAKNQGINVNSIVIDEDCAIDAPEGAGKRGLVGCLFMFKIAGGMASLSKSLEEIYYECGLVKKRIATLGVTLKPCNMPGLGPMFEIEEGYMEVGVGIHGEAGASKRKIAPADEIASIIVSKLYMTLSMREGDRVCVIINNLGGSSQLELFLMAGHICTQLKMRGIHVVRHYAGSLMTSLDMAGIQVSMLTLPKNDKLWLDCLDTPTTAFAWPGTLLSHQGTDKKDILIQKEPDNKLTGPAISDKEAEILKECLRSIAAALKLNEQKLNELDSGCGDGDTGSTLRRMSDVILQETEDLPVRFPQQCFTRLSQLAEDVMGGTSGALYSLMFVGASKFVPQWAVAWQGALNMAMTYSKAKIGSRTMFDALIPACETFNSVMLRTGNWKIALSEAVDSADDGCKQTAHFKPLYGRASYVSSRNITTMDAGAYGVTVWLHAIKSQLL